MRLLAIALAVQLMLGGLLIWAAATGFSVFNGLFGARASVAAAAPSAPAAVPRATVHRFDASRAWAELRAQVAYGPRPAGSPALARLAERLRAELPNGHFEAIGGQPGLRNVVGELPGRAPAIVIGAHYDTSDVPGSGPNGSNAYLGANDGAAGAAVVVELAREQARLPRAHGARAVRFVLFDGEEAPAGTRGSDFYAVGDRGSKAYVAAHRGEVGEMILLDFVGNVGLRVPREANSDPRLWARLRAASARVGVGAVFPPLAAGGIIDDHTPFVLAGLPAIDVIDFDYPCHERACDTPSNLSPLSLDAVGEALDELLPRERRR